MGFKGGRGIAQTWITVIIYNVIVQVFICFRNICTLITIKPSVVFRETKTFVDVSLLK